MTDLPGAAAARDESEFARAVRTGLGKEGQKELPSRYFYDAIGSALFDVITLLPEYGLTRADARMLRRHARKSSSAPASHWPSRSWAAAAGRRRAGSWKRWPRASRSSTIRSMYPARRWRGCAQELAEFGSIVPLEASYLDGLARGGRTPRGRAEAAAAVSGQHDRQFRRPAIAAFPARSAGDPAAAAIRCCWAPTC